MIISRNKAVMCSNCGTVTPYNVKCTLATIRNVSDFDYSASGSVSFRCYKCNKVELTGHALDAEYISIAKKLSLFGIELNNAEILQRNSLTIADNNYIKGYKYSTFISFKNPFKKDKHIDYDDIFIKILRIFSKHGFITLSINFVDNFFTLDEYNLSLPSFKDSINNSLLLRILYDDLKLTTYLNSKIEDINECTDKELNKACSGIINIIKHSIKKIAEDLDKLYEETKEEGEHYEQ